MSQAMVALAHGNKIRVGLSELKRRVASGEVDWRDVLDTTDPVEGRIRVDHLLRSAPGIGMATAEQMLVRAGVAPTRRVDALTDRQKGALRDACTQWRPGLERPGVSMRDRALRAERERDELRRKAVVLARENRRLRGLLDGSSLEAAA